jgi:hypothetical protein
MRSRGNLRALSWSATAYVFNTQKPFCAQGIAMSGYIKLHRGWHDSAQFSAEPYCERAAWCWLLTNAAWKGTVRRNHKGEVVPVARGQFHTSLRTLAAEWQWSPKRVKSFLEVLQRCGSAETVSEQSGTLITICKYEEYQSNGSSRETASYAASSTAGKQSGNTQEEVKEGKEEKNTARARSFPRPDGVSAEVWADFMAIRKAKRAPMTDTAWKGFVREADKAGLSINAALEYTVVKSWQSFSAEWWRKAEGETRSRNHGWVDKDGYELPYA